MIGSSATIRDLADGLSKWLVPDARIAITSHVRPDGDAIGSSVGLYHILRHRGLDARIVGLDAIPQRYAFLCENTAILTPDQVTHDDFTLLIILDTGAIDRAPDFVRQWQDKIPTLNIDHHPTNTAFATYNYVQPNAAAVADIITRLAVVANWEIPPPAAAALWVGITTDTGRFAYSCTTAETMQAAAKLLAVGIDIPDIDQRVFQTLSLGALRLQARAIDRMQVLEEQRLAVIALSQQDFRDCGACAEDAEEIINLPRRLDSIGVAVLLTEMVQSTPQQPRTKASFRTRPPFDAGAFCQARGGGGHARAAGCEIPSPLEEATRTITAHIQQAWFLP